MVACCDKNNEKRRDFDWEKFKRRPTRGVHAVEIRFADSIHVKIKNKNKMLRDETNGDGLLTLFFFFNDAGEWF